MLDFFLCDQFILCNGRIYTLILPQCFKGVIGKKKKFATRTGSGFRFWPNLLTGLCRLVSWVYDWPWGSVAVAFIPLRGDRPLRSPLRGDRPHGKGAAREANMGNMGNKTNMANPALFKGKILDIQWFEPCFENRIAKPKNVETVVQSSEDPTTDIHIYGYFDKAGKFIVPVWGLKWLLILTCQGHIRELLIISQICKYQEPKTR